jgi:hypothetical protein
VPQTHNPSAPAMNRAFFILDSNPSPTKTPEKPKTQVDKNKADKNKADKQKQSR